ncbi:phosphotransferase [Planctomycetes bacterium CA13]
MSGSLVFRVTTSSGDTLALKGYSIGTTVDRVTEIHSVMQTARNNGCDLVAELVPRRTRSQSQTHPTICVFGDRCWELTRWVEGHPFNQFDDSKAIRDAVSKGATAIARFHDALRGLGGSGPFGACQPAPCIAARIHRIKEIDGDIASLFGANLNQIANPDLRRSLGKCVERLRAKWRNASGSLARSLDIQAKIPQPCSYVMRDIHHQHIFFASNPQNGLLLPVVSGIIDFDAVRVDSPATDLARWTSSFLGNGSSVQHLWDAALAGYRLQSSLNVQQEALFRGLIPATAWISLANWAIWLVLQRRSFPVEDLAIAERIEQCVRIVDSIG